MNHPPQLFTQIPAIQKKNVDSTVKVDPDSSRNAIMQRG